MYWYLVHEGVNWGHNMILWRSCSAILWKYSSIWSGYHILIYYVIQHAYEYIKPDFYRLHNTFLCIHTQWSGCLKTVSRHPQHVFKTFFRQCLKTCQDVLKTSSRCLDMVGMSLRQYLKDMLTISRRLEDVLGHIFVMSSRRILFVFNCLQDVLRCIFQPSSAGTGSSLPGLKWLTALFYSDRKLFLTW